MTLKNIQTNCSVGLITGGRFAAETGERGLKSERHNALAESTFAPLPKRQRVAGSSDHNTDTAASQPSSSESMMGIEFAQTLPPSLQSNAPSEDEILIQMIQQSGAVSYDQVVEFCRSSGIPLSRMLRLDLMRQLGQQGRPCRPRSAKTWV